MITACRAVFSQRMGLSCGPVLYFQIFLLQRKNIFVEQGAFLGDTYFLSNSNSPVSQPNGRKHSHIVHSEIQELERFWSVPLMPLASLSSVSCFSVHLYILTLIMLLNILRNVLLALFYLYSNVWMQ